MEVIEPGPSAYHHKRKRVNGCGTQACFVPGSKSLDGVERESGLGTSPCKDSMYKGGGDEGEKGVWRGAAAQPYPLDAADGAARTASSSSTPPADSGGGSLVSMNGEEGDHTDESCSNSTHGGDEVEARPDSESCKSRLAGMVQTFGGEVEARMSSMGARLASMERRLDCIGMAALEASAANNALQNFTYAVVWRKQHELDQQMAALLGEVDRRLNMHTARLTRLSNLWCRFTDTTRAGTLSLSRELAFLRGQVESQGSTIQKLIWQLAARDAEINFLKARLTEAGVATASSTEGGSTAAGPSQPAMAAQDERPAVAAEASSMS